ncbi:magnesium transporter CorA family protein [Companilactobacillus baiquanensis]|uniref:Magnesium transporter CorA family protein n=1 Tax=Companilactobacillus baiquanensis TaxID=2486005 RepID=A0ABW1UUY6_9LACO|nr:magnesium transporter CorA family protein [Companilactobacillus baiquanensis]
MITQEKLNNDISLIDVHSVKDLNDEDRSNLIENYQITNEILDYADDTNERARLEYDEPNNVFLIVYNAQNEQNNLDEASEITLPISFAVKGNNIFLFTNNQTHYVKDYIIKADKNLNNSSDDRIWSLIFNVFDQMSNDYNDKINEINHDRNRIQEHIKRKRSSNAQIFELSNLQDLITYISTSINGNFNVVKQMEIISNGKIHDISLTKDSHEHLHDSIIEIEQIREQASLTADIIDRVANTYNNILNNQTNTTMKILTIYTIVLSIPTIVSGFYGMNMPLPVSDKKWSWVFSIILTIFMIGLILWDLNRRDHS